MSMIDDVSVEESAVASADLGVLEVRRNGLVAGLVGVISAGVAIAYLARATQSGAALDWVLALCLGLLAAAWLRALIDARTPLLVADGHGIRIRLGRSWHGLVWSEVGHVDHFARRGLLRDGRVVVVPADEAGFAEALDAGGRREFAMSRRLHGAPLAVPLGMNTTVTGPEADVLRSLELLAAGRSPIVDVRETPPEPVPEPEAHAAPETEPVTEPEPAAVAVAEPESLAEPELAEVGEGNDAAEADRASAERTQVWNRLALLRGIAKEARKAGPVPTPDAAEVAAPGAEAVEQIAPTPGRSLRPASRSEISMVEDESEPNDGRRLTRSGRVDLVEDRANAPEAEAAPDVEVEVEVVPVANPVIGPIVAGARRRLGLSVEQLAERTRIRPHVIEAIEVDDFVPCGGDFYARGHLRTLARILGIDAQQLLTPYDERYANAPIDPRRVFQAELATGVNGSIRSTRGGLNWSVLLAVVMALVLCWSVARLVFDSPADLRPATPVLNGSGGPDGAGSSAPAKPVSVVVSTPAGGAHVVVRDGAGQVAFKGGIAAGQTQEFELSPPVRVQSSDGAVTVAVGGAEARLVGEPGVAAQSTFVQP